MLATLGAARDAIADDDLDEAKTLLDSSRNALKQAGVAVPQRGLPKTGVRGAFETISPVEAGLGLGAHLLGFLIYIGLLVVGFQTLYVNQGTAFGSNGIFDYVGLVLWGSDGGRRQSRTWGTWLAVRPRRPRRKYRRWRA